MGDDAGGPQRVFTVEAPGLTSAEVAAILERAIADGVYEIPERTGARDRINVGPLRGTIRGRALAGSITAWRGASGVGWWYPSLATSELALEGTLRDTEDGAELRIVLRPSSIRPVVIVGLVLTVVIGVAVMSSDPAPVAVLAGLGAWAVGTMLARAYLTWAGERSLERSVDVHRFLVRILRLGAADDTGWRERTWR